MKRWCKENKWVVYVLPLIFFPLFLTFYGLFKAFIKSMNGSNVPLFDPYIELFTDHSFWKSLFYSLHITIVSTVISLIIGLWLTRSLYKYMANKKWKLIVWIPMIFPHFVAGYMIYLLLGQTGFFSTVLAYFNLINDPSQFPALLYDSYGLGIIFTYIWKEVPFVILMLLPVYLEMNRQQIDVVKTLGGSEWEVFKTVEWPWLVPILFETGIILFSFILAAYEVPALLGATYPKMVSVLAFEWFYESNWTMRPKAFAIMIMTSLVILMLVLFFSKWVGKKRYRLMKGNGRI